MILINNDIEVRKNKFKKSLELLISQNNLNEAKEFLNEYEKIIKDDIDIYSIKGVISAMEGDMTQAENILKEGLLIDKDNFDLLYNLGYIKQLNGDNDLAIKYYRRALKNAKDDESENLSYEALKGFGLEESKEELVKCFVKSKSQQSKLKVVFLPYKISMWDSLETIYKSFIKDEDFIVDVVPIPYYKISQDNAIPTYEGERFPSNIPITHYSEYNIEEEKPDIIFVHNIYDEYNTITRVYEEYLTINLKKHTNMLVYVPYHIPSPFPPYGKGATYALPSVKNVDKIILVGDYVKKAAIKDGISESKLLTLGSPKLDFMVNNLKRGKTYPNAWKRKLDGKTVYALETGCMYFVSDPFAKIEEITNILNITNINKDTALIWRPHPLTRISIMRYVPQLLPYYDNVIKNHIKGKNRIYNNVILDQTDNYLYALNASDVLISGNSSLLGSYLLTEKKIIFLGSKIPKGSVIPQDAFYYFYDEDESWYYLIEKINNGYDPLAKNRKGIASKIYKNIDGDCGETIYQVIKKLVKEK